MESNMYTGCQFVNRGQDNTPITNVARYIMMVGTFVQICFQYTHMSIFLPTFETKSSNDK